MTQMTMGGAGASKASGVLEEASCCSSGALAQQKKRPTLFSRPRLFYPFNNIDIAEKAKTDAMDAMEKALGE